MSDSSHPRALIECQDAMDCTRCGGRSALKPIGDFMDCKIILVRLGNPTPLVCGKIAPS
jgi:hypothetical protein